MELAQREYRVLAILLLLSPCLRAQAVSGTILGSVRDTSGAAVADASVTIVNAETDLRRTATTNSTGEYDVPPFRLAPTVSPSK